LKQSGKRSQHGRNVLENVCSGQSGASEQASTAGWPGGALDQSNDLRRAASAAPRAAER
jgi:hypothetical protein